MGWGEAEHGDAHITGIKIDQLGQFYGQDQFYRQATMFQWS